MNTLRFVYDANGGSGAAGASEAGFPNASSYPVSRSQVIQGGSPTRAAYTFLGWSTNSAATNPSYQNGSSYSYVFQAANQTQTVTFFAVWRHNTAYGYFNANGGSGAPGAISHWEGYNVTIPETVPTRPGYTFLGWSKSETATTADFLPGVEYGYPLYTTTTLYAVWAIARASITTVTDAEIEGTTTITIQNDGGFTLKAKFVLGSAESGLINVTGTTLQYTVPASWYAQTPTSVTAVASVYLYSYNGDTLVGTDTATFTVTVPDRIIPSFGTLTASKVNDNTTVNAWDIWLQSYTKARISAAGCAAGAGSTIASYTIAGEQLQYNVLSNDTGAEATSGVLPVSGQLTFTATITDARGRRAEQSVTITVLPYAAPNIVTLTAYRSDASGNPDDVTGAYFRAVAVYTWSQVGGNTLTSSISHKQHDASAWTTDVTGIASGMLTSPILITIDAAYDVRAQIRDALNNSSEYIVTIQSVLGFSLGLKNDRGRFGGVCYRPGLQIDWDIHHVYKTGASYADTGISSTLSDALTDIHTAILAAADGFGTMAQTIDNVLYGVMYVKSGTSYAAHVISPTDGLSADIMHDGTCNVRIIDT